MVLYNTYDSLIQQEDVFPSEFNIIIGNDKKIGKVTIDKNDIENTSEFLVGAEGISIKLLPIGDIETTPAELSTNFFNSTEAKNLSKLEISNGYLADAELCVEQTTDDVKKEQDLKADIDKKNSNRERKQKIRKESGKQKDHEVRINRYLSPTVATGQFYVRYFQKNNTGWTYPIGQYFTKENNNEKIDEKKKRRDEQNDFRNKMQLDWNARIEESKKRMDSNGSEIVLVGGMVKNEDENSGTYRIVMCRLQKITQSGGSRKKNNTVRRRAKKVKQNRKKKDEKRKTKKKVRNL